MTNIARNFIMLFTIPIFFHSGFGQTINLEELPNLDLFSVSEFKVAPDGTYYLKSRAENDYYYTTNDRGQSFDKFKETSRYYFLENGTYIYRDDLISGSPYFNVSQGDTTHIFDIQSTDEFEIFKNFIILKKSWTTLSISNDNGLSFQPIDYISEMEGFTFQRIESSNDMIFIYGEKGYESKIFVLNEQIQLSNIIDLDFFTWTFFVSSNNDILLPSDDGFIYTNDFFENSYQIESGENINLVELYEDKLFVLKSDESIIQVIYPPNPNLSTSIDLPENEGNFLLHSSKWTDELFLLSNEAIYRIDGEVLEKVSNITSSPINKFQIVQSDNLFISNWHNTHVFNEINSWHEFKNSELGEITYFEFDKTSNLLLFATLGNEQLESGLYKSFDLGETNTKIVTVSNPIIISKDTILSLVPQCVGEGATPPSQYTIDGGFNWGNLDYSSCITRFDNKPSLRIKNNFYIFGQTYTYITSLGSPGFFNRFLDEVSLTEFDGENYEISTSVPYANNSYSLLTNNEILYINAFPCDIFDTNSCSGNWTNDDVELPPLPQYPSYISNDLGQTFTQVGMAPSGKLFEGPDGRGVLLINNDEDDSRLYYREFPQDDFIEIIMEPSEIGKLKYIRHGEDGTMYLATRHSHIYKTNGLAEFGQNAIGKIYFDKNENCIYDEGDILVPDAMVAFSEGDFEKRQFVQNGDYRVDLPLGEYQVEVTLSNHFEACNSHTLSLTNDGVHVTTDIGFIAADLCTQVEANIGTAVLERCFDAEYTLDIENNGAIAMTDTKAIVTIDPLLELKEVGAEYIMLEDNKIEITLPALDVFEAASISILVNVSCQASLGQQHCMSVELVDLTSCSEGPNLSTEYQNNVGSFDPNDIRSFDTEGFEEKFFDKEEYQYYQVRFQNTGSAPARDVRVNTFISEELDITSIKILSASHSYNAYWKEEGILELRFDHINLPDSVSNPSASHGFFKFRIKPIEGIDYGTSIYNEADIYFDFNEAVNTGEVETVIMEPSRVSDHNLTDIRLYPNPTVSWLQLGGAHITSFQIFGLEGSIHISNESTFIGTIDISSLQNGIYFFEATTENGKKITKKFIKM